MKTCLYCPGELEDAAGVCAHCGRSQRPRTPVPVVSPIAPTTKRCPFCAEEIQGAAVVCKHCGRDVRSGATPPTAAATPVVLKVRQADWISTTAKWGVGFFFVIIGVSMCSTVNRTAGSLSDAVAVVTQPSGVTLAQFSQLRDGTSYAEAVQVLGHAGTEQSRSTIGGTTTVMYGWPGSGSLGANMNAMFQDDRLITKAQFGLR